LNSTQPPKKKPEGASIIFLSSAHEALLCLRDDKDTIPYPNKWDLLGGGMEAGETARQCIIREIKEEIEFDLRDPTFFKVYDLEDHIEHLFWQRSSLDIAKTPLHEGQRLQWFSEHEIRARPADEFAFGFRALLLDFYDFVSGWPTKPAAARPGSKAGPPR
jgi:8-oxo-dGTP diphosphatase